VQQLIQNICSYPPYLEAFSYICNLKTFHAVVTRDLLNMQQYGYHNEEFKYQKASGANAKLKNGCKKRQYENVCALSITCC
jgi:hypothetical protein